MYHNQEYKSRFRILKGGLISLVVASNLYSAPSGGVVTSGTANISQNGNITNINQSTNKASINWQDFSIKSNEIVNFHQPNQNSITLNRVVGNEKSIIDGSLNANGQVWILNSNGTLFGKNAKVNTAGLLVTTKNLSDKDFQNGNYDFKGNSTATIENLGNIDSTKYASFIANSVINNGIIKVHSGTVNIIGASEFSVTLDENSNISLKVNKGVLDALVENNNLIIANNGSVYLTTNAKDELLKGVVNNRGKIEANSISDLTNKKNEVILFAHGGTANIDGSIIAKNSFVETSGKNLSVKDSFKIEAKTWLLDPVNMTIEANGGNNLNGESVSANAIQNALGGTNVHLQADNVIAVNENITWNTEKQLKLQANGIRVNATINNTNSKTGGVYFQAQNTTDSVVFGTDGKVIINNINQLQWIDTALNGKYELGSNIDALDTKFWNSGAGFKPIGDIDNSFGGVFDGKGFTISRYLINRPTENFQGLFGVNSGTIKNLTLDFNDALSVIGKDYVGALVGQNRGIISSVKVYSKYGQVEAKNIGGGLVGQNYGTISDVSVNIRVNRTADNKYKNHGARNIGGLVGENLGTIQNSDSSGAVSGQYNIGGLVGHNVGDIINSVSSGEVRSTAGDSVLNIYNIGGLVGQNRGTITSSNVYADLGESSGSFIDGINIGGLVGDNIGTINNSNAFGNVLGTGRVIGGLVGLNSGTIYNSNATLKTDTDQTKIVIVRGQSSIGGLVGENKGTISSSYAVREVYGSYGGGLVGINEKDSTITSSYAVGNVESRSSYVGGLVAVNRGSIIGSYFGGTVKGDNNIGGLVGDNEKSGKIDSSFASGDVRGNRHIGGLVGYNSGVIENSFARGSVAANKMDEAGGLVGWNDSIIKNSYAIGYITSRNNEMNSSVLEFLEWFKLGVSLLPLPSLVDKGIGLGLDILAEQHAIENDRIALVGENRGTITTSYVTDESKRFIVYGTDSKKIDLNDKQFKGYRYYLNNGWKVYLDHKILPERPYLAYELKGKPGYEHLNHLSNDTWVIGINGVTESILDDINDMISDGNYTGVIARLEGLLALKPENRGSNSVKKADNEALGRINILGQSSPNGLGAVFGDKPKMRYLPGGVKEWKNVSNNSINIEKYKSKY